MGVTFNADEIFAVAEQIERNGAKFYRKAAGSAAGEAAKKKLINLAVMEDGHEKVFAAMRTELPAKERFPASFDPDGEAALYLQALADGKVFDVKADPSETLKGNETLTEILKIAIGLENDSIVFYLAIKDLVGEALGRGRIDEIIKEELGHVAMLSNELAVL